MKAPLEFWFDFASPYSYVAALRVEGLATAAELPLVWRPFLLGAVFQSQGLTTTPFNTQPARRTYMMPTAPRCFTPLTEKAGCRPTCTSGLAGSRSAATLEAPRHSLFPKGITRWSYRLAPKPFDKNSMSLATRRLR